MAEGHQPTAEAVMKKIKDDGDFDALRLKIVRVVKENEELRNSIVNQIKQSDIIKQYVSEDMKPRQLSDAIFQELGRKVMGQISDEIWKVISSDDLIKDDIRSTVESVFNMMAGIEPNGATNSRENRVVGTEGDVTNASLANPWIEANTLNSNGTNESSGFSSDGHRVERSKNLELEHEQRPSLLPLREFESPKEDEALPPGFGPSQVDGDADEESDRPPGFD